MNSQSLAIARIHQALEVRGEATTRTLSQWLGYREQWIHTCLLRLEQRGLVVRQKLRQLSGSVANVWGLRPTEDPVPLPYPPEAEAILEQGLPDDWTADLLRVLVERVLEWRGR